MNNETMTLHDTHTGDNSGNHQETASSTDPMLGVRFANPDTVGGVPATAVKLREIGAVTQNRTDNGTMMGVEKGGNGEEGVDGETEGRGTWAKELDFILACVGWAVGIGNIWRFPYLCYKNGGGAFLVPYLLSVVTCGVPLFLLEIGFGQYMRLGSIGAWRIAPAFQGIGLASFSITTFMNMYYIIVLTWALFYLYMSLTSTLPWSHCGNEWNTDRCFVHGQQAVTNLSSGNTSMATRVSMANMTGKTVDSAVEFWERRVLQRTGGVDEPGSPQWELVLALFVAWLLVYFCIWRGVRWSGKVVYFTALFPYVILTCLFFRGVTLEGAAEGIKFYLKPDFERLADPQVWVDGGTQVFFSYAVALGAIITMGSYNKFTTNFYRDVVIVSCVNTGTSLFGGFAVFSVLGFMAHEQNVTVAEVAEAGPGLVFIAYPKAVTQMPGSTFWSILFFCMVILVGLDSQFMAVEGWLTPVFDRFPSTLYKMRNRVLVTAIYCFVSFLAGLSMVTQGGIYIFQLFDYYSASGFVLLWVCFCETVVIAWVFGTDKFMDAIELMIGRRVSYWFVLCWRYITPTISTGVFLFMLVSFKPLKYNDYEYPWLAQLLGACLAIISILCIPITFIYKMATYPGNLRQKWRLATTPKLSLDQIPMHWDKRNINVTSSQ